MELYAPACMQLKSTLLAFAFSSYPQGKKFNQAVMKKPNRDSTESCGDLIINYCELYIQTQYYHVAQVA